MSLPDGFKDDRRIYPMLAELRSCLANSLGETSPCFCGIIVGNELPMEYAGECEDSCGAAYVRLASAFPSNEFPAANDQTMNCNMVMAYGIAIGVLRCGSVGFDDGEPPTPEEMSDRARMAISDLNKMREAITCCFTRAFPDAEYSIGTYTPIESQGGVHGGEFTLTLREIF